MTREEILKNTRSDQREVARLLLDYIDALYAHAMDEVSEIKNILAEDVIGPFTEEAIEYEQFPAPALDGVPEEKPRKSRSK